MDWEVFVADAWESVNDSLYTEQAGSLAAGDPIVVTIGETWQGALYGTEEDDYGQRAVYLFQTEDEQRSWYDAVTGDMRQAQDYCEVCGQPAAYDVRDVNGTPDGVTLWVSVCGDACADRVVASNA